MATRAQIRLARQNGILIPYRAAKAAKNAGIPFYVACAFLMQESGGGRNVYGHDTWPNGYPKPFWGHGEVTEQNYAAYKRERDAMADKTRPDGGGLWGRRMQGVGPLQLTYWSFQDQADAEGGCWNPYPNCLIGFRILASYKTDRRSWIEVASKYNTGSYSTDSPYAQKIAPRLQFWGDLLGEE